MASKTIYLDDSTLELGEKLAGEDVRSFSNLMAFLIQQEWLRRQRAAEITGTGLRPIPTDGSPFYSVEKR
jgi:hypothetical protein